MDIENNIYTTVQKCIVLKYNKNKFYRALMF